MLSIILMLAMWRSPIDEAPVIKTERISQSQEKDPEQAPRDKRRGEKQHKTPQKK